MTAPKFSPGEVVFAKIKGFAPWPAKVEFFETIPSTKQVKYNVYFYGTNQIGQCKEEDLFPYSEYRDKFGKPKKIKGFMKGLCQADKEIGLQDGKLNHSNKPSSLRSGITDHNLSQLDYLKAELEVLKIDQGIKSSLKTGEPQLQTCLELLDRYSNTTIVPLMFKKNPLLIDTIMKVQVYSLGLDLKGPNDLVNCSKEIKTAYEKANLIRTKARNLFHKIQSSFTIPQGEMFIEAYAEQLEEFKKSVEHMSEDELLQLSTDPTKSD